MSEHFQELPPQTHESRKAVGCLGALLIHPLLFVLAFLKGFVLGSAQEMPMSATGGVSGPTKYLVEGGLNAMGNLTIYYLFVGFFVVPIASLLGSLIAMAIGKQWSQSSTLVEALQAATPPYASYSRKLTIWAASLYLTNFCVSYLLFHFGDFIGWDLVGLIIGCNLGIWIIGAITAYITSRDWRIPAWLMGILVFLILVRNWLPGFSLFVLSVGALLCVLSYPEKQESHQETGQDSPQPSCENKLSGLSVFVMGGFTYYTLTCLYGLVWALSLPRGSENWGPAMLLILGVWGIPVAGGIVLLLYRRTRLRSWIETSSKMTSRFVWMAVAGEVCVCGFAWLGVVIHQ